MEFSLNAVINASEEIADSVNYPNLRLATVDTVIHAISPMSNAPSIANYTGPDGKIEAWRRSEPDAFAPAMLNGTANTKFSYFSAACYLFGRDLYKQLGSTVPIGLVASDVGGVKIETLMSQEALVDESCGGTAYRKQLSSTVPLSSEPAAGPLGDKTSALFGSNVWNGMIYPLLPMRFVGVVFYQGESNSLAGCPSAYACLFPALITDWRAKFDLPDLSFLFVQLAAYGWHDYTHLRQAQLSALQLPGVGMATAIDLGDMKSPNGGIHPRLKQEVGRRLALTARAVQYLEPGVQYEGPRLQGMYLSNSAGTEATLTFAPSTAHSLHLAGAANCVDCCKTPHSKPYFSAFQTQAPNGTWISPANASVHRNAVVITSEVPISGVRQGWGPSPDCLLYNGNGGAMNHSGLVAPPFRECLYGTVADLPPWNWLSDCHPTPASELAVSKTPATIGSSSTVDWILGATAVVTEAADASTTGIALSTGKPKGSAVWVNRNTIGCGGSTMVVDSIAMTFRYRAAPPSASTNNTAALMKINLINSDNKPIGVVSAGLELGNFSTPGAFSQPVVVNASGLKAICSGFAKGSVNPRGRLLVQIVVTNNDRPVIIPL